MLLITNFLELGMVAGIRRTLEGRQHPVSGRPMLIHTYHAVPMPFPCRDPAVALRGRFQNNIFVVWQGNGMVCVNETRPNCVNQMEKTQSKPLAERNGNGMVCVNQTRPHCVNQMGKTQSKPLAERHGNGMVCVNQFLVYLNMAINSGPHHSRCSSFVNVNVWVPKKKCSSCLGVE
jgi:hypothetical protein